MLASLHRKPLPEISALAVAARRVIVLEDLVDHANVGAIFRCAAALGVDAVFLSPRCATRSTGVRRRSRWARCSPSPTLG